ncbi:uncharacterized protein LOC142357669, partial [Convolutriloba macropyga]|uniref:uncharacterized protein LOC142357669 n=1 Tax=Convolutriloba macropyga TaxID=536237 RepID=UPI003F525470
MNSAGPPHGSGLGSGFAAASWSPGGIPPRSPETARMPSGQHKPGPSPPYSPCHSNTPSDEQSEQSYPYFVYPKPNGQSGASTANQLARSSTPETTSALFAEATQQAASCDGNLAKHQELWLFDKAAKSASQCTEWHNPCGLIPGEPTTVTAALVQAPASFNNPCKMKKIFRPPFRLKIVATYPTAGTSTCKATGYMLSQQQVATLHMWNPEIHGAEAMLKGNTLEQQLTSTSGEQVVHEMEFTELKFCQPTRMSKRYLLVAVELNPGPTLWVRYTLPTVVVSRSVDQYNKAVLILKDIQPMDGRSLRGMANAAASAAAATDAAVKALKRTSPYTSEGR